MCFWDMVTQELIAAPKSHAGVVSSMAIAPDDSFLLTGGADGLLKVWRSR